MRYGPSLMIGSVVMFVLGGISVGAQPGATNGEWRSYAADTFGSKYSPLEQITADNFTDLEIVWRWQTADTTSSTKGSAVPRSWRPKPSLRCSRPRNRTAG